MLSHLNFGRRVGNGDREGFTTFTALRRQHDDHSTAAVATRRTGGNFTSYRQSIDSDDDDDDGDVLEVSSTASSDENNINEMPTRGEPFWYNHPAKSLLKEVFLF